MRIPTLAVCALAALAAQDWNQQAIAASSASLSPESESTNSLSVEESTAESTQVMQSTSPNGVIAQPETFGVEALSANSPAIAARSTETAATPMSSANEEADAIADERVATDLQLPPAQEPTLLIAQTSPTRRNDTQGAIDIPVQPPLSQSQSMLTAQAQPAVRLATPTRVTIQGQDLPVPGALPTSFRFPIRTRIVSNPAITTNTPITDQEFPNPLPRANVGSLEELARYREARTVALNVWAEQIRGCMLAYPNMVSLQNVRRPDGTVTEEQIPVLFNGERGSIVSNANGRLVCPN
ncbi:MAG: hypothetical protein SFY66_03520 [Oculatellaceae cyanobacterium bins.114]|nr:hypothetical protein [Oculatellaceae cyanobacterium bins.114]